MASTAPAAPLPSTMAPLPVVPQTFRVPVTGSNFAQLCGLIGFSDKLAKIVKEGLNTASFFAEMNGRTGEVVILSKGAQVIGTMRVGLKALDTVTDFANFVDACQKDKPWKAVLSALSIASDGLGNFNDFRSLAGVQFDPRIERTLREASGCLTVASLTPLVITQAVEAANLAAEARQHQVDAVKFENQKNIWDAALCKWQSEEKEAAAVTKVMSVMEKTITIALVVFGIVAAAFALASVIVVPVIAALTVLAAVFGIIKLCREQFINFKRPEMKDYDLDEHKVDALRHPVVLAVANQALVEPTDYNKQAAVAKEEATACTALATAEQARLEAAAKVGLTRTVVTNPDAFTR